MTGDTKTAVFVSWILLNIKFKLFLNIKNIFWVAIVYNKVIFNYFRKNEASLKFDGFQSSVHSVTISTFT